MSRKKKDLKKGGGTAAPSPGALDGLSERGKKTMALGAGLVVLGFAALARVDPLARNWAGVVSPLLIVGGYAAIGLGIFLPESSPTSQPSPDPQKTNEA